MYNIQLQVPYEKQQYIKKMNHVDGGEPVWPSGKALGW